ncbi:hypothetical protein Hdeb2414_s0007g00234831 [Helianthus debilis subsp. tardiflorus]
MMEAISKHGTTTFKFEKDLEGWVTKKIEQEITKLKDEVSTGVSVGCSLLLDDEWLSNSSQRFVTFSVCCKGKVVALDNFIKCKIKTEDCLVEQVLSSVGVENVVQIISNSLWML